MNPLSQFLSGAAMMVFFAISFFFYRFWKKTHDSLFAVFSASFFVLAIERIILFDLPPKHEWLPFAYLIRLAAFLLIAVAILLKNIPRAK